MNVGHLSYSIDAIIYVVWAEIIAVSKGLVVDHHSRLFYI